MTWGPVRCPTAFLYSARGEGPISPTEGEQTVTIVSQGSPPSEPVEVTGSVVLTDRGPISDLGWEMRRDWG